jgi:sigma-E processing peptidase SpoIIGA
MQTEVYADLLFLVNFSMDFLTLYLVARLCSRPLSLPRALLSATLGALYAIAVLFLPPSLSKGAALLLDGVICLLLTVIGLHKRREGARIVLRLSAFYLLISALLGGLMTLLYSLFNRVIDPDALQSAQDEGSMTFTLFSVIAPLATGVCLLLCRSLKRATARKSAMLHITDGGQSLVLRALCDSGNLLHDPITHRCVIPVAAEKVAPLLPRALASLLKEPSTTADLTALPPALLRRTRLIPAKGATGERLLVAYSAEHLYLDCGKGLREIAAYLAPIHLPGDSTRDYDAIVPTELLPG